MLCTMPKPQGQSPRDSEGPSVQKGVQGGENQYITSLEAHLAFLRVSAVTAKLSSHCLSRNARNSKLDMFFPNPATIKLALT